MSIPAFVTGGIGPGSSIGEFITRGLLPAEAETPGGGGHLQTGAARRLRDIAEYRTRQRAIQMEEDEFFELLKRILIADESDRLH